MRDIPIIFSAPMVRALLDGRKTMTRRLALSESGPKVIKGRKMKGYSRTSPWQRVKVGDRLWVRESLQSFQRQPRPTAQYAADITGVPHCGVVDGWCDGRAYWQWTKPKLPSIHMPRWASRLTLIVTATKIERLDAISESDAIAEGIQRIGAEYIARGSKDWDKGPNFYTVDVEGGSINQPTARATFALLWDILHGEGSFNACQQVVALTFTVHKTNIDALPKAEAA